MDGGARLRAVRTWFVTGRFPGTPASPDDLAAFAVEDARWNRFAVMGLVVVLGGANVVYWFEDQWAFEAVPELLPIMDRGRAWLVGIGGATLVGAWLFPRWVRTVAAFGGVAAMCALTWALGACGGPSTPWLYYAYPYLLLTVGVWMTPWERVVALVGLTAALIGAYFAPHPAYWGDPVTRIALGHLLFVLVLCWGLGVAVDQVRLRLFLAQRHLDREREGLAQQVERQTHDLRELARRVVAVRDAERARIARDLHDDLGQTLTAARLVVHHALSRFDKDPASIGANLDLVASSLDQLAAQTRTMLREMRADTIDDRSLGDALEDLVTRMGESAGVETSLDRPHGPTAMHPDVARAAWRCSQEALTNVARHSRALRVDVRLAIDGADLVLTVSDDGVGFSPDARNGGLGLVGMRERVGDLGGAVDVSSAPGQGTRITARMPTGAHE